MNDQPAQEINPAPKCPRCSHLFYNPDTLIADAKDRAAEWEEIAKEREKEITRLKELSEFQKSVSETMLSVHHNEIERLKSLTTDNPEHGNEYAIVVHYKMEMERMQKQLEVAKEALEKCDWAIRELRAIIPLRNGEKVNKHDIDTVAGKALAKINGDEK